ncbi:uncharacterized protein LOC117115340 [Anneissia japonica]|uniref:uncharacterized protein LOC117115340 n=1 Tax=Anneissia japonica TaxID=1529436 RepID=UPI0014256F04|nr:uncharacterized protein LOC117115340 [Anneissia japonica]
MVKVIQSVVLCILLGFVYGAPADATSTFQHKFEETFDVEGQTLTDKLELTDDGIIINVEDQDGSIALTVSTDYTHGLLIHRYHPDDNCYISSIAQYDDTKSVSK